MNDQIVQKVTTNWNNYKNIVSKIEDEDKQAALLELCEDVVDRAAVCPASTKTEYIGCFPGGLVWHSLNVVKLMKELSKLYGADIPVDSLIIAGLFHDIGKLGTKEEDYYLPQSSRWHLDKGIIYEINPELYNLSVANRSLHWLSQYRCPLSEDEIGSISSLNVKSNETISYVPSYKESWLGIILQQAVRASCVKYNGVKNLMQT
jgi:putative nucleotidyltransferase with HDIG domain